MKRDIAGELRVIVTDHLAPDAPLARSLLAIAQHVEDAERRLRALEHEVLPQDVTL